VIRDKRIIAIVPARGGSKGIASKNIKLLCGKPLIVWTIDIARRSKLVDELVVSTDSQEIADIARGAGASVPFVRPAELATNTAPTMGVVEHVLEHFRNKLATVFEYVVLLEPTSPLREDDDIDQMLSKLDAHSESFDSIVSIGQGGEHPSIMKRIVGDRRAPFAPELTMTTRRQDNEPAFFPYGVAYIAKTSALATERTFYTKRCTYHRIKRYQNYEIDDLYDFLAVEAVMRQQWNLK
jgi:CMP-N,N'-diacetyllegionaminic acid synthase